MVTLIDNVYTNNLNSALSCNILTLDLTDHLATHTKVSLRKKLAERKGQPRIYGI